MAPTAKPGAGPIEDLSLFKGGFGGRAITQADVYGAESEFERGGIAQLVARLVKSAIAQLAKSAAAKSAMMNRCVEWNWLLAGKRIGETWLRLSRLFRRRTSDGCS